MKPTLHVIGITLALLMVVLAAQEPPVLTGPATAETNEFALLAELQAVRRDRRDINESWDRTVEALQQSALRLDAPAVIIVRETPPRQPVSVRLPATGVWSAAEAKARKARGAWIAEELRKRAAE